jgi:putative NADPH-quinone reductase
MPEPVLDEEGQATLEAILERRPAITRPALRQKITHFINLTMQARGSTPGGKDLVLEATRFVISPAFTPHLDAVENLGKYRDRRSYKFDKDAYYTAPRIVKRWPSVAHQPQKPPREMKVLAFNSSPRKGGNTDVLMDEALRGASEAGAQTEKYMLQKLNIRYCVGCRKCKEPGYEKICSLKDDMSDFIYQKILDADVIVIGLPIYTGREPAQLATFFDRLDCERRFDTHEDRVTATRLIKPGEKTAMVICTWGYVNDAVDVYDHIVERMMVLLHGHRVETVEALSACGFAGMLHGFDDDHRAIILRYPEELKKAYEAGRALVTGE